MAPWNVVHGCLPGSGHLNGTLWYIKLRAKGGESLGTRLAWRHNWIDDQSIQSVWGSNLQSQILVHCGRVSHRAETVWRAAHWAGTGQHSRGAHSKYYEWGKKIKITYQHIYTQCMYMYMYMYSGKFSRGSIFVAFVDNRLTAKNKHMKQAQTFEDWPSAKIGHCEISLLY